jgi:PPOX class probable F420-dependent enzyme
MNADGDVAPWTATRANAMTEAEMAAFLDGPHVASLGTYRADGFIHLTPIWYLYEGGAFYMTLAERRRHLRNMKRDPRATVLVHVDERREQGPTGTVRAVMACGTAEISSDPAAVDEWGPQIDARYVGAAAVEEGEVPSVERYELVVIRPVTVLSWDFGKR